MIKRAGRVGNRFGERLRLVAFAAMVIVVGFAASVISYTGEVVPAQSSPP